MSEGNGASEKDLLLKLLATMERLETNQRGLQASVDRVDTKLNNTNGTLTLVGRVLNELTSATQERVEDHEKRLRKLEAAK